MKTTQFSFLSKDGKTSIHAVRWAPDDGNYTAVLQITHGMVEYIERYTPFADYLTRKGFLVVGHDHIGHGHSVTGKAELGYFTEKDPSGVLVEDMHQLRVRTQKDTGSLPYFMLGHSMGSFLLRKYLALHAAGLSGAIIMGTGYIPAATTKMGLATVKAMTACLGSHHRSPAVQKMIYGPAYRDFDTSGQDPHTSWLTRDAEIVKKYYSDRYCTYTFTLNGFRGLLEAAQAACDPANIAKIPKELPVLLISGGSDPVGDLGKGVEKVQELYQQAGIQDLDLLLYEGARHEVLNEINREQVYEDLHLWLQKHAEHAR